MTYPDRNQPPPVSPGPTYFPPQQPPAWPAPSPPPTPANKRPLVLAVVALAAVVVVGLAGAIAFAAWYSQKGPSAPPAPQAPVLTQAGAERACRTAFTKEFDDRQAGAKKDDIVISTQGIDLVETFPSGAGYKVNGTIRFTLTTWPLDPVQDTLQLTCTVTGSDEQPATSVDNRG